jgi:hypothetical protein
MTSKRFWLRLLVMSLAFAMTAVGCDGDDDDKEENKPETDPVLNGTWLGDTDYMGILEFMYNQTKMKFTNGNIETSEDNMSFPSSRGNYTTTREGTITITYTHYFSAIYKEWFSKDLLKGSSYVEIGRYQIKVSEKILNEMFSPHTYTYYITDSAEGEILIIGEDSFKKIN